MGQQLHPRFGCTSTGSVEGLNSHSGTARSPWSRGYLRYLHGVVWCRILQLVYLKNA